MKMKKNKLTNLLKILILCVGITLTLFNCENNQDTVIVEPEIQNSQPITTNTDFKTLQKDPLFSEFVDELQLEELTDLNPTIKKKSKKGGITLNPSVVKKVVQGSKVSYNILAKRQGQEENIVENVVLQNINGEYRSLLIKYTLKQTNKSFKGHFHKMGSSLNVQLDQVEIKEFNPTQSSGGGGTNCYYETITIQYSCTGTNKHPYGSKCNCGIKWVCTPPREEFIQLKVCEGNNTGVSGTWNNNTSNITSDGGGGGISSSNSNGISTFTYENPEGAVNLIASKLSLNQSQIAFLNDSEGELVSGILNLLGTNKSENFAIEVIKAKMEKPDTEINFEEQIINQLKEKEKCAYEKMTSLNLFKSTINKFENNDNYNLTLKSWTKNACNSTSDDGCTDASDLINGNITIYIQNPGRGTLDVAAMILHEGIHAEIFKYVDEYKKGLDPSDRANLLNYYFQYKAQNDNTLLTSTAQHQHMADKYIRPIAEALRQLDKNKYPLNDYMGLAWDGLRRYGWDGYYDNGNWVTLDRNQYTGNINKVLDNTEFNNDCN